MKPNYFNNELRKEDQSFSFLFLNYRVFLTFKCYHQTFIFFSIIGFLSCSIFSQKSIKFLDAKKFIKHYKKRGIGIYVI